LYWGINYRKKCNRRKCNRRRGASPGHLNRQTRESEARSTSHDHERWRPYASSSRAIIMAWFS
jgi:hypothetical protein